MTFLSIKKSLELEVGVEIKFLINVKLVFDDFMTKFQKEEPMINLLYPDIDKEDVNLQLSTKKFKEMQIKLHCKLQAFTENMYSIFNAFSNLVYVVQYSYLVPLVNACVFCIGQTVSKAVDILCDGEVKR